MGMRQMPMDSQSPVLLELDHPDRWPPALLALFDEHHELFEDWESGPTRYGAQSYDRAMGAVWETLQPFALRGWHCTRLTDDEISEILANGLQLPDVNMLHRRLDALAHARVLSSVIVGALKAVNQAHETNRAGMIWFAFFQPKLAGEGGIERFFRHWGGEALYNSHEDNPLTSPVLRTIGTPCLVEAVVPIAHMPKHGGLSSKVVRRALIARGHRTSERVEHEDRVVRPLPAPFIQRIVRFPDADFVDLTGCSTWDEAL